MPRPAPPPLIAALAAALAAGPAFGGEADAIGGFLENHCVACHGEWAREGGLNLEALSRDPDDADARRLWVRVHDRVENGEMPPPDDGEVPDGERGAAVAALSDWLAAADADRRRAEGRASVRRLNRAEYEAALRDLLKLPHLEVAHFLPPDGREAGFDKSAGALDVSPVLLERYLEAADRALREAVAWEREPPESTVKRVEVAHDRPDLRDLKKRANGLYIMLKGTTAMPLIGDSAADLVLDPTLERTNGNFAKRDPGFVRDEAPHFDGVGVVEWKDDNTTLGGLKTGAGGVYKIRVHGFAFRDDRGRPTTTDRSAAIAFSTAHGYLGTAELPPNEAATAEVTVRAGANLHVRYAVASAVPWRLEGSQEPARYTRFDLPGAVFKWFELEGPFVDRWPPAGHVALFGDLPLDGMTPEEWQTRRKDWVSYRLRPADPAAEADELLRSFLTRALRRPVTDEDLVLPRAIVAEKAADGEPFLDAMLAGYRAVLCSPDFLLVTADRGPDGRLTPHALAERLALFLWNSVPDAELRAAADDGSLADPDVLAAHADRLLDDPRAGRFADHFLDHWLDLADFDLTAPDENLYPEWKPLLDRSVREEPRAFFRAMLADDLPARSAVDSDFLTLNRPLADLYGVPGVEGFDFRRVPVPESGEGAVRGGLLTTAAVLKVTANGTSTSPVVRGAFVLDRLLGTPPPPPPPAVPAVEPDISGATTVREQLAAHRADPACAGCHAKIDPPGFALESFDVMGRFRDRYRSLGKGERAEGIDRHSKPVRFKYALPVDASGVTEDGAAFADVREFRALLLDHERQLARNLLERLTTYATGAPVQFGDRAEVDRLLDAAAGSGYGVRTLIRELVRSRLFLEK